MPDAEERKRWVNIGRRPDVLDRKLDILEEFAGRSEDSLVERLDWTENFRDILDEAYEEYGGERRRSDPANPAWADALDRGLVADAMRSGKLGRFRTREIVPAYTSYTALDADFKLDRVSAGRVARPDDRLVGVIGWEFLVPEDTALDDDNLLKQAVRLVQDEKFRTAREEFHKFRWQLTQRNMSPEDFLPELESKLRDYQKATAIAGRARIRTTTLWGFSLVAAGLGLAAAIAAMPPLGIAAAALGVTRVGVDISWRTPKPGQAPQEVAMFHDARKHFGWDG